MTEPVYLAGKRRRTAELDDAINEGRQKLDDLTHIYVSSSSAPIDYAADIDAEPRTRSLWNIALYRWPWLPVLLASAVLFNLFIAILVAAHMVGG